LLSQFSLATLTHLLAFKGREENDIVVGHKEMGNLLVEFINKVADFNSYLVCSLPQGTP
jgi:hypothetical protein